MDENEKKNLNGSIKSFIGDRLSKAKEKDVKEKSGDSVSSGTGIDRSNIRQPKAGFGKTESSSSTGTEVKEDGGELSAEEVRKAREKAETERIKAEKKSSSANQLRRISFFTGQASALISCHLRGQGRHFC